jgi:hypothetical protein
VNQKRWSREKWVKTGVNEGGFAPKKNLLCATLWLRVENNNKFIRRKKRVREAIERYCLNQYDAKRLHKDGWEYELRIPYNDDEDLERQIEFLMQEMYMTADDDYCFIEADLSESGGDRRW